VATPEAYDGGGASLVSVVTDDRPFLVDSVTMALTGAGWSIREVFHPQLSIVRRDDALVGIGDGGVLESWMQVEAVPRLGEPVDEQVETVRARLAQALDDVTAAVADWGPMRDRARETIELLRSAPAPVSDAERRNAADLLAWLADDHFTFLGYRESVFEDETFRLVPGSGLGILRGDEAPDTFHAVPVGTPELMVMTKDSAQARVHRPTNLDYVGIRLFDEAGRVVGERRFLGLLGSTAYTEAVARIPVLASKADEIVAKSGYWPSSHGAKAIRAVIDTYPRDELFQASVDELFPAIEKIAHMAERRQVRLFLRRGPWGRMMSCLVYLPRDRYTTAVRNRIQQTLLAELDGESLEYQTRVSESVLARLFFVVRTRHPLDSVDVADLERKLDKAVRHWDDDFMDEALARVPSHQRGVEFPDAYKEDFTPEQGILDLEALNELTDEQPMKIVVYRPSDPDDVVPGRIKVFRRGEPVALADAMPHLTSLGLRVIDERPYEIELRGERAMVYDFGVELPAGAPSFETWDADQRHRLAAAVGAGLEGKVDSDPLDELVVAAGLSWVEVTWLRAISRYLRQAGSNYSQPYIASALVANHQLARVLADAFRTKFEPIDRAPEDRDAATAAALAQVEEALDVVESLDHDRIMRAFLAVIAATVRTNAFVPGVRELALKLLPGQLDLLPQPRPAFEIFVYSPRVEGVHLRFGTVARGGLRWSDRREDFRTEVLGLVKAQMVKNTVIVPVGAKGGFVPQHLPDPSVDRQAWLDEGIACYTAFIEALLSVTDNIVEGGVVGPEHVVRYDPDDPYLVVAADKGTATFSDIANGISLAHGFWLGDAFASGGSVGYDHKGMGITARGAWESVKRHFHEMGIDCQDEDFTCVGIGDMAGDVFGNGMLLSRHTKLVAAFNHMHIFVDPDPDPEASYVERERLFNLPRSTWKDYDASLISAGGGVFERSAKSVPISAEMRAALGLADDVSSLVPTELISAILTAPVDLLWNGGIGTYVKATSESHAQVGDRANDVLRVNGADVRARCAGEGGNLGWTQLGRIEYARGGGRINTDFIDNSAGVDTSDYEVNIKILLDGEVRAGRLTPDERNALLPQMTDDVAALVLAHNVDQNLALATAVSQAAAFVGAHETWMARLEEQGQLDRKLESLPSPQQMRERFERGEGLTGPELATLLAYTKIVLKRDILASDLPDDPYLADRLIQYFPPLLRDRYRDVMPGHRLHREIITTVAVNRFVNSQGISAYARLSDETGLPGADIMRAQLAARSIHSVGRTEVATQRAEGLDAALQTQLRLELRRLVERGTRWLLRHRRSPIDIEAAAEQFTDGVSLVRSLLPDVLTGRSAEAYERTLAEFTEQGMDADLARSAAGLAAMRHALTIVQTAQTLGTDLERTARTYFLVADRLRLDEMLTRIEALPRLTRWEALARGAARDDLLVVEGQLASDVLSGAAADASPQDAFAAWAEQVDGSETAMRTLTEISSGDPDLARVSVGLRLLRALVETPS